MKKVLVLGIMMCVVATQAGATLVVQESPGTMALWRFDSSYLHPTNGATYTPDNVARTPSRDLSIRNGAAITTGGLGYDGEALQLDGVNDFGLTGWDNTTKNILIEMSIKPNWTGTGVEHYLVEIAGCVRLYFNTSNQLTLTIWDSAGVAKTITAATAINPTAGNWYNVKAGYGKKGFFNLDNEMDAWLLNPNGTAFAAASLGNVGTGQLSTVTANIAVGSYRGTGKYYGGLIDEMKINNLTPEPATLALLGLGGLLLRKRK